MGAAGHRRRPAARRRARRPRGPAAGRNRIEVCTPELIAVADETLAIGKDLRKALRRQGPAGLLPAAGGPDPRLGARLRGARALEPPGARPGRAGPLRPGRRGVRPDLRARPDGAVHGDRADAAVVLARSASRSTRTSTSPASTWPTPASSTWWRSVLQASGLPATQLVARGHRGGRRAADSRPPGPASTRCTTSACGSPSTTSAPAARRWPTCSRWPWTSSRSTAPTSTPSTQARAPTTCCAAWSASARRWASRSTARASRTRRSGHRLRRNGCDIGQGYLFARPLPAEDAAALPASAGRPGVRRAAVRLTLPSYTVVIRRLPGGEWSHRSRSTVVDIMSLIGDTAGRLRQCSHRAALTCSVPLPGRSSGPWWRVVGPARQEGRRGPSARSAHRSAVLCTGRRCGGSSAGPAPCPSWFLPG